MKFFTVLKQLMQGFLASRNWNELSMTQGCNPGDPKVCSKSKAGFAQVIPCECVFRVGGQAQTWTHTQV